jgi:hypothetical protein
MRSSSSDNARASNESAIVGTSVLLLLPPLAAMLDLDRRLRREPTARDDVLPPTAEKAPTNGVCATATAAAETSKC